MDNTASQPRPRQVIVDVQAINSSNNRKRRRRKRNRHHDAKQQMQQHVITYTVEDDEQHEDESLPLELMPVIDAAKVYARQLHALGVLHSTKVFENFIEKLKIVAVRLNDEELTSMLLDAKSDIGRLRSEFRKDYSIDDEVSDI
jgi:uncharacterized circularly permuted ATP-grasp superfamily protein